jgi:hypothetical protein
LHDNPTDDVSPANEVSPQATSREMIVHNGGKLVEDERLDVEHLELIGEASHLLKQLGFNEKSIGAKERQYMKYSIETLRDETIPAMKEALAQHKVKPSG